MGDIADMMLDGTLCECCGEYIDDEEASGFARYCSKSCSLDRGVDFLSEEEENDEDEEDEEYDLTLEDIKSEIEVNILMLEDNAKDLKKFNSKKSRALKGFVKNLKLFLESLKK